MPNDYIDQIQVGTTTYDIQDTYAREHCNTYYIKGTHTTNTNSWTGNLPEGIIEPYEGMIINYWIPKVGSGNVNLTLTGIDEQGVSHSTTIPIRYKPNGSMLSNAKPYEIISLIYQKNIIIGSVPTTAWFVITPPLGTMAIADDTTNYDDTYYLRKKQTWVDADSRYYTEDEIDTLLSTKADLLNLGNLAFLDNIDYTSEKLINKPSLSTMAFQPDAPSDDKQYGRKNGDWVEIQSSTTYTLPIATSTELGGIKIGDGLSIDNNGIVSVSTQSSGGGTWGTITGTISDQTDLQAALSTKVNVSDMGGIHVRPNYIISDVDLEDGISELPAGQLYFYYEV